MKERRRRRKEGGKRKRKETRKSKLKENDSRRQTPFKTLFFLGHQKIVFVFPSLGTWLRRNRRAWTVSRYCDSNVAASSGVKSRWYVLGALRAAILEKKKKKKRKEEEKKKNKEEVR